jgi:hypothetical protein
MSVSIFAFIDRAVPNSTKPWNGAMIAWIVVDFLSAIYNIAWDLGKD